jgi:hypothetical protein
MVRIDSLDRISQGAVLSPVFTCGPAAPIIPAEAETQGNANGETEGKPRRNTINPIAPGRVSRVCGNAGKTIVFEIQGESLRKIVPQIIAEIPEEGIPILQNIRLKFSPVQPDKVGHFSGSPPVIEGCIRKNNP